MPVVVDASVAVGWAFADEDSAVAERIIASLPDLGGALVPPHWSLELSNAIASAVRRGRMAESEVPALRNLLHEIPYSVAEITPFEALGPVLDLAHDHELTAYDAAYVHLALREDVSLATLDRDLRRGARAAGVTVIE